MSVPTLLTFTMMKNEGPFILEWVAWQRLLGVDQIIVLSNDCNDGTDAILDRLQELGIVRHLPNPISVYPSEVRASAKPQTVGFAYGRLLPEWRKADYIFLTDVDEFPCIRNGDPTLKALLKRLGYPDVLTMCETVFGTGDVLAYEDKLLTEQFTKSTSLNPGKWRSRRGFKSISRNDPHLLIRNHRPKVAPRHAAKLNWIDGSGRAFPLEIRQKLQKGGDCRGMNDLVTLNHYALRSLESFLVKVARGQPMGSTLNRQYFRRRNQTHSVNEELLPQIPRLQAEVAELRKDPELADLHVQAVEAHRLKIAALKKQPLYAELLKLAGFASDDA